MYQKSYTYVPDAANQAESTRVNKHWRRLPDQGRLLGATRSFTCNVPEFEAGRVASA